MIQKLYSIHRYQRRVKLLELKAAKYSWPRKVYDESPIDVARKLEDSGIKVVHIVDFGWPPAHRGSPVNYHIFWKLFTATQIWNLILLAV